MATTIKKVELVKTSTELIKLFGIKSKDWDPKNQDETYMKEKIIEAMNDCFEEGDEITAASQKVIDAVQAEAKAAAKSTKKAPVAKGKKQPDPEPDEDEDEDTDDEDEDEPTPAKKKGKATSAAAPAVKKVIPKASTTKKDPDPEPDEDEDEETIETSLAAAKSMIELKAVQAAFPAIFTKKVLKGLETAKNPIMLKKAMKDAAGIVSAPKVEKEKVTKGGNQKVGVSATYIVRRLVCETPEITNEKIAKVLQEKGTGMADVSITMRKNEMLAAISILKTIGKLK